MKNYKVMQDLGMMGVFKICDWKSTGADMARLEFLQMNPQYKGMKRGFITIEEVN